MGVWKNDATPIDSIIINRILPYVKDNEETKVWETWCPDDRDLFFLDKDGHYADKINLTPGFPENHIKGIIDVLLEIQN